MAALLEPCQKCALVREMGFKREFASRNHGHGCNRQCDEPGSRWHVTTNNHPVYILSSTDPITNPPHHPVRRAVYA